MSDGAPISTIPTRDVIEAASKVGVFDEEGKEVLFGDVLRLGGGQGTTSTVVVVFVRHFFCGTCQAYVSELAKVPEGPLTDANVHLVVIGCGEHTLIGHYRKETNFKGKGRFIYADPSRELYRKLGMTVENLKFTPADQEEEKKKSYVPKSFWWNVVRSTWKGFVMHPLTIGKQGNLAQLGGEFIFGGGGPDRTCQFARRMEHTEDHVEVADLMKAAGVKL